MIQNILHRIHFQSLDNEFPIQFHNFKRIQIHITLRSNNHNRIQEVEIYSRTRDNKIFSKDKKHKMN